LVFFLTTELSPPIYPIKIIQEIETKEIERREKTQDFALHQIGELKWLELLKSFPNMKNMLLELNLQDCGFLPPPSRKKFVISQHTLACYG
jgi:hypothetical protein